MTTSEIRKYAEKFNKDLFDNELNISKIDFKISKKMINVLGNFRYQKKGIFNYYQRITISENILISENDFENTLIHEMVHAWQFQKNKGLSHGYTFIQKSDIIKEKSNGKYCIRKSSNNEILSSSVINKILDKKAERVIKINQYAIIYKNQVNFIKNLNKLEIDHFKVRGYKIFKATTPITGIRNCKNIVAYACRKYYYSLEILDRYRSVLKEI